MRGKLSKSNWLTLPVLPNTPTVTFCQSHVSKAEWVCQAPNLVREQCNDLKVDSHCFFSQLSRSRLARFSLIYSSSSPLYLLASSWIGRRMGRRRRGGKRTTTFCFLWLSSLAAPPPPPDSRLSDKVLPRLPLPPTIASPADPRQECDDRCHNACGFPDKTSGGAQTPPGCSLSCCEATLSTMQMTNVLMRKRKRGGGQANKQSSIMRGGGQEDKWSKKDFHLGVSIKSSPGGTERSSASTFTYGWTLGLRLYVLLGVYSGIVG